MFESYTISIQLFLSLRWIFRIVFNCKRLQIYYAFQSIADDVDKAWFLMLHQLLSQLRQDLSLPNCLQIVGHLRRMEVFTETELRLKFLQTRNCWLEHCLKSIPKDDGKLKQYHFSSGGSRSGNYTAKIYCVHWFYNCLFF